MAAAQPALPTGYQAVTFELLTRHLREGPAGTGWA